MTLIASRRIWQCRERHERRQFTVKVGTIFEDSPLALDKWLTAIWMLANSKNGISSYELRSIGVTQKTAWFMLHRIRLAMQDSGTHGGGLSGQIEVDETFIGGKARFMHADKRAAKIKGTGGMGKVAVMGLLDRHGPDGHSTVALKIVPNTRRRTLAAEVRARVVPGSEVMTDALKSYGDLADDYIHGVIDHAEKYVEGTVHTNGLENFWSLLKRGRKGHLRERRALPPLPVLGRGGDAVQHPQGWGWRAVPPGTPHRLWSAPDLQATHGQGGASSGMTEPKPPDRVVGKPRRPPPRTATPFERFEQLARRIVQVPKRPPSKPR